MPPTLDHEKIALFLTVGTPIKVRPVDDGSLVVVAQSGEKFIFSPEQIQSALDKIYPKKDPKPASIQSPKQAPKKSTSPLPPSSPSPLGVSKEDGGAKGGKSPKPASKSK